MFFTNGRPYVPPGHREDDERAQQVRSCDERDGGHRWVLRGEHPDDGAGVQLDCQDCPATDEDLVADHVDLIFGKIGDIMIYAEYDVFIVVKPRTAGDKPDREANQ
jgi:hypothetical protein